jgi:hypothetical protein
MRHVYSFSLAQKGDLRVRHLTIANANLRPKDLEVDEIFAYAWGAREYSSLENREWSKSWAQRYIDMARAALQNPSSRYKMLFRDSECKLNKRAKKRIEAVLQCAQTALQTGKSAEPCDAQRFNFACP